VSVSYDVHRQVLDYIAEKVEERRRNPGDDLISRTLAAEIDGRRLRDEEVLAMCGVVMFAGLDTVVSSLGFIMRFLAESPAHRAALRDAPQLIPNAVDEMLRRFSPTNLAREAKADMMFAGARLKAGDPILLPTCLHGLDEQCWERPLEVDFQRRPILHLAFGTGVHRCIGSLLARTELRVMLSEWLPLIPEFEISPGATVTTQSGQVNAVTSLPLSWQVN
jgi:cytochrome P450